MTMNTTIIKLAKLSSRILLIIALPMNFLFYLLMWKTIPALGILYTALNFMSILAWIGISLFYRAFFEARKAKHLFYLMFAYAIVKLILGILEYFSIDFLSRYFFHFLIGGELIFMIFCLSLITYKFNSTLHLMGLIGSLYAGISAFLFVSMITFNPPSLLALFIILLIGIDNILLIVFLVIQLKLITSSKY